MNGQEVGVHPSTINRELNRNIAKRGRTAGEYFAKNSRCKTNHRHDFKPKLIKLTHYNKKQAV
jgi:IS30 family transposase